MTHWGCLQKILERDQQISPLFKALWVTTKIFRIDWLHCADQGVAADYLGNLLLLLTSKLPGRNKKQRTSALWEKVQQYYKTHKVQDKLQNLTITMLCQPKKAPKLRASAAQCRALVPCAWELAVELLFDADPVESAAKNGMYHLNQCYSSLSHQSMFALDVLRQHSMKFALIYVALEALQLKGNKGNAWKVKPKLHLFLELCSEGSKPQTFWNYRDEDYGGSVAKTSRRRGGLLSAKAFSSNLPNKFKMQTPVVRIQ